MIEKVVEDWLTSISERNFEAPFAQLLMLQGYRVVHFATPHGPQEQGKDILAIDDKGQPVAFQMKANDLTLGDWRHIDHPLKGQVEDMLDTAIQHPGIRSKRIHRSFLVTTGRLDNTLRDTITTFNVQRENQQKPILNVMTRADLVQMILGCLERFVPLQDRLTKEFMRLYLVDGTGLPDKERLSAFFKDLQGDLKPSASPARILRLSAEIVLLASHLVHPYQIKANHIGQIEVWWVRDRILNRG